MDECNLAVENVEIQIKKEFNDQNKTSFDSSIPNEFFAVVVSWNLEVFSKTFFFNFKN